MASIDNERQLKLGEVKTIRSNNGKQLEEAELLFSNTTIAKFVVKLTNETKNIKGEKLVELVLNELSTALHTDNNRIIEILTYMASLSPEDIQKVLVHSVVETMQTDNKAE